MIGGYTDPQGSRIGLGALLLGMHDASGKLRYAGNVGTGFDEKTLRDLKARLSKIHTGSAPFVDLPPSVKGHWVKPELVAEVAFGEWTHASRIRHAVFHGLRTDKPARDIVREIPVALEDAPKESPMPAHADKNIPAPRSALPRNACKSLMWTTPSVRSRSPFSQMGKRE